MHELRRDFAQAITIGPISDTSNAELVATDLTVTFSRAGGAFVPRDSSDVITSLGNGYFRIPLSAADCAAGIVTMDVQSQSVGNQLQFGMDMHFVSQEYLALKEAGVLPPVNVAEIESADATDYLASLIADLATTAEVTAAVDGLNDLSAAQVNNELSAALNAAGLATAAALSAVNSAMAALTAAVDDLEDVSPAQVRAQVDAGISDAALATAASVAALHNVSEAEVTAAAAAAITASDLITLDTVVAYGETLGDGLARSWAVSHGDIVQLAPGQYAYRPPGTTTNVVTGVLNEAGERSVSNPDL